MSATQPFHDLPEEQRAAMNEKQVLFTELIWVAAQITRISPADGRKVFEAFVKEMGHRQGESAK